MSQAPRSVIERQRLRAALRSNPRAADVLKGRQVNDLGKADLEQALRDLGLDPVTIAAEIPAQAQADDAQAQGDDTPQADDTQAQADGAIEEEIADIRRLVMTGGFIALDDKLRDLVTQARKPAEVREVRIEVPVMVAQTDSDAASIPQSKHTSQTVAWRDAFDVPGALGDRTSHLWDGAHPDTPRPDARYIWPHPQTAAALVAIANGDNVFFGGPAGTGKTQWAYQLAAALHRPISVISCDSGTDAATLTGMTVPAKDGGTRWQDGQLTRAIRTPGCVVLIDEPSVARPGALFVMQNMLENRVLTHAETGLRIPVAPGVIFLAADNTLGEGGGAREGYTDTARLNRAFMDRFSVRLRFDFMAPDQEADALCSYVPTCPRALAVLLVSGATTTRALAQAESLSRPIGFRRLKAWAKQLVGGTDPEYAFEIAVLNASPVEDHEALRSQVRLSCDPAEITAILNHNQSNN